MTDERKWEDPWYAELPAWGKLLWLYLCDSCDHGGVWKVNRRAAQFAVGADVVCQWDQVAQVFGKHLRILDAEYWLVVNYVKIQNRGPQIKANPFISKAIEALQARGLNLADVGCVLVDGGSSTPSPAPHRGANNRREDKRVSPDLERARVDVDMLTELAERLNFHGLQSDLVHLESWRGLLTGKAGCRTVAEVIKCLDWMMDQGVRTGHVIKYSTDATALAARRAEMRQAENFRPGKVVGERAPRRTA